MKLKSRIVLSFILVVMLSCRAMEKDLFPVKLEAQLPQIIFIIGKNASGKSTISKELTKQLATVLITPEAEKVEVISIDSDQQVDEKDGRDMWSNGVKNALTKAEQFIKENEKRMAIVSGFVVPELYELAFRLPTWVIEVTMSDSEKHLQRLWDRCKQEFPDNLEEAQKQFESQSQQIRSDEAEAQSATEYQGKKKRIINYTIDNTDDDVEASVKKFIQQNMALS